MSTRLRECWSIAALLAIASCSPDYSAALDQDGDTTSGPQGVTIPLRVTSDTDGLALSLSALPAAITISPAVVTIANGAAHAYALVPYGTSGTIVAAAAFATTASLPVSAGSLVLCAPSFVAADGEQNVTATGKVYSVSVQARLDGDCANGTAAPAGVSVAFSIGQATGSPVSATALTDANGIAHTTVLVPWGAPVFVQAVAGGGSSSAGVTAPPNPATVSCVSWTNAQDVFKIDVKVTDGTAALPAMPVSFSIVTPSGTVGTVSPSTVVTNTSGLATSYVSIPNAGNLPVTVEITSGGSSSTTTLTSAASDGTCQ